MLRVCRLPKNIDERIERFVKDTMFVILILHILFAIWIYGNSNIFPEVFFIMKFCEFIFDRQLSLNSLKNINLISLIFFRLWDQIKII